MIALWDTPTEQTSAALTRSRSFSFVAANHGRYACGLRRLDFQSHLLLEGPYGQDLQLQTFENVILVAQGVGIVGLIPYALDLARRRRHDELAKSSLQDLMNRERHISRAEKDWEEREKDLSLDEETLGTKRHNIQMKKMRLGGRKQIEADLEREARSLQKERRRMDREKKDLQQEKASFYETKRRTLSTMLFSDSTRKIDVFWQLDHNDQGEWAAQYLQALQELDPSHVSNFEISHLPLGPFPPQSYAKKFTKSQRLVVVWCFSPSPRSKHAKPLFRQSDYWLSLYPRKGRPAFGDLVASTIENEAQSPGETIVVGKSDILHGTADYLANYMEACGEAMFTDSMRKAAIEVSRPDRLVSFSEVEYQPQARTRKSRNRGPGSSDLSVTAASLSEERESDGRSSITRSSSSSFGFA